MWKENNSMFLYVLASMCACVLHGTKLFNVPIYDPSSPMVEQTIITAQRELKDKGSFLLSNFLSEEAISLVLSTFSDAFSKGSVARPEVHRNVWQKHSVDPNLSSDHPFNQLLYNRMGYIGKKILENSSNSEIFLNIYNNSYLYSFLSEITNSDIYPSSDEHGGIYGLIGRNNDVVSWHFDEHPFSCVWVIRQSQYGGAMRYIEMEPIIKENGIWEWDNQLLTKILNNDKEILEKQSQTVDGKPGDVYCFWGNVSLHEVVKIEEDGEYPMARQVFVTAFSTVPDFKHSSSVHELNDWCNVDN